MKIGNVSFGTSYKKGYTHDLPFDINTTCDFGSVQPVLCQYMEKDDKFSFKCHQLVRLATTINPTFGIIHSRFDSRFVNMCDVYPAYDALVSHTSIKTDQRNYVPSSLPMITNNRLLLFLFNTRYCRMTVYRATHVSGSTHEFDSSYDLGDVGQLYLTALQGAAYHIFGAALGSTLNQNIAGYLYNHTPDSRNPVAPGEADYYLHYSIAEGEFVMCVRFNNAGRKLRKILVGLGYSLEYSDFVPLSMCPILAFYKAWFDQYAVQRYVNWHDSPFYEFINHVYNTGVWDFTFSGDSFTSDDEYLRTTLLFQTLAEECIYTYPDNFFSVHTDRSFTVSNDYNVENNPGSSGNSLGSSLNAAYSNVVPTINSTQGYRTSFAIETVSRLTKFLSKNSLIGKNVANYIKVHFGSEPSDDMFADSNFIGSFDTIPEIKTLISTSDTVTEYNVGEPLGKQGSFGIGDGIDQISYRASTFGFAIVFHCIYPELHFNQGNDPWLLCHDRYTFPSVEFDALGYELTPKSMIYDNSGIRTYSPNDLRSNTFGFIPRFSGLKVKKSLCNGNMSLLSTRKSFDSFYLDASIRSADVNVSSNGSGYRVTESHYSIPDASVNWRYLLRYPFLGYFNRIFLNAGFLDVESFHYYLEGDAVDDNFTLQCHVDYKLTNKFKSITQSFDTYDDEIDNDSVKIKPE